MADRRKSVRENAPGDLFVDSTCIDCDTCRQLAPEFFGQASETAYVLKQPSSAVESRLVHRALVSCPTGSIGSSDRDAARAAQDDFPLAICGAGFQPVSGSRQAGSLPHESEVYYCGFTSPKSYGGSSYLIRHPAGNWLVDSPKFLPRLAKHVEELGGIRHIFLTHRDDVADARRWAEHFGATRHIHRAELRSQPDAENVFDGESAIELSPGFVAIPTPGHTAGHAVLLHDDRYLFTGDHLAWDRDEQALTAFRDYCWDSWPKQIESLRKLLEFHFEWVLPGHGQRVHLPNNEMHTELAKLVSRIEGEAVGSPTR